MDIVLWVVISSCVCVLWFSYSRRRRNVLLTMNRKVQHLESNCKLLKHVLACFSNLIKQLCNTWVFSVELDSSKLFKVKKIWLVVKTFLSFWNKFDFVSETSLILFCNLGSFIVILKFISFYFHISTLLQSLQKRLIINAPLCIFLLNDKMKQFLKDLSQLFIYLFCQRTNTF